MSSAAANNSAGAASFEIPSTIYNQTISTTREDGRDQPPPPPPSSSSVLPTPIQTTPLTADSIISNLEKRMSELKRESQSKGAKGGAAEQGAFSSKSTSPTSPSRQHRAFTFPLAAGAGGGGGSSTVSSPHRQRHSDPRQIDADLNDLISNNILQEINAELAKDLEPKSSALSAHGETGRDDDLLVSSLTSSLYQTITTTTNTPSTNDAVAGSSASKTIPTPNIHHQQNNGDVDTSSISFSFNWDKTNDELSRLKLAAAAASSSSNGGGVNSTSLAAHHQHLDLATEDDFDDSVLEKRFESLLKGEIARAENILNTTQTPLKFGADRRSNNNNNNNYRPESPVSVASYIPSVKDTLAKNYQNVSVPSQVSNHHNNNINTVRRELDAERFTNASDSGTSLEYQRHHHQQQYPANDNTAAASIRKGIDDILFRSNSNGTTTANGASSSSAYQQTNGGVAHTDPFYPTAAHQNLARSGLSISSEQDAHRGISTIPEDGSSRAVISALRTLQEKIARLESEKMASKTRIMNLEHELAIEKKRSLMTTPTIIPAAVDATNVAATQTSFAVDSKKKSAPSSPVKQPDLLLDNDFLEKIKLSNQLSSLKNQVAIMERELLIEKDRVQHIATSTNSTQAPSKRDASSSPTTPKASDIQQQHEYIPASNPALIHPHHAPPQSHDRNPSEPKDWKLNKLHESFNKGGKISQDAVELQQLKMEMEREKAAREHDMWKEVKSTSKRVEADREQLQRTIAGRSDVKESKLTHIKKRAEEKRKSASAAKLSSSTAKIKSSDPFWKTLPTDEELRGRKPTRSSMPSLSKSTTSITTSSSAAQITGEKVHGLVQSAGVKREMPFVVGQNVGKSYSVTANIQKVFSLLKAHNPALCSVCSKRNGEICDEAAQAAAAASSSNSSSSLRRSASSNRQMKTRSSSVGSLGRTKSASQSSNTRPKTATGDNSSSDRFRASSNPKLGSGSGMNSNGGKNKSGSTGVKKAVAAMYTTFYPPDTLAGVGIESLVKVLGILEDDFRKLKTDYHKLVTQYESASAPLLHSSSSGNSNKYDNLKRLKPIGDELREVIRDMEVKGDQITILRDIVYSSVNYLTGGGTNTSQQQQPAVVPTQKIPPVTVTSTTTTTSDKPIQEPLISVKDHDWITRKPTSSSPSSSMSKSTNVTTARSRSQSPARAAASLSLLKSSFKVQTALRESIEKGRRL